jgi:hypothetical protein
VRDRVRAAATVVRRARRVRGSRGGPSRARRRRTAAHRAGGGASIDANAPDLCDRFAAWPLPRAGCARPRRCVRLAVAVTAQSSPAAAASRRKPSRARDCGAHRFQRSPRRGPGRAGCDDTLEGLAPDAHDVVRETDRRSFVPQRRARARAPHRAARSPRHRARSDTVIQAALPQTERAPPRRRRPRRVRHRRETRS